MGNRPQKPLKVKKLEEIWNVVYGYQAWQEISDKTRSDFFKWKNELLCQYESMEDVEYNTIEDCVEAARQIGNHLAFAHYFLEKSRSEKEMFSEKLREYIDRASVGRDFYNMIIISEDSFVDENIDLCSGTNAKFKKVKPNTLRSWGNGRSVTPNRYEIVQCGLYLNLTSQETNELLSLAGMQKLYEADGIDLLCIFYLEYFHLEPEKFSYNADDGYKRIIQLKQKINEYIKAYFASASAGSFIKDGKAFVYSDGIVTTEKIRDGENYLIEEEICQIKEGISACENLNLEGESELVIGKYGKGKITKFYYEKLEEIKKDIDKMDDLIEKHRNHFAKKYYELQRHIVAFIKEPDKYIKNLAQKCIDFSLKGPAKISLDDLKVNEKDEFYNKNCKKIFEKKGRGFADSQKVAALECVWRQRDYSKGAITTLKKLLNGRLYEKGLYKTDIKRDNLIYFCLVTGQEDNLSMMLKLACFRDYINGSERSDLFLQYLFMYRDALIKAWSTKYENADTMIENEYRKNFPMIELCKEISKEVGLILELAVGHLASFRTWTHLDWECAEDRLNEANVTLRDEYVRQYIRGKKTKMYDDKYKMKDFMTSLFFEPKIDIIKLKDD